MGAWAGGEGDGGEAAAGRTEMNHEGYETMLGRLAGEVATAGEAPSRVVQRQDGTQGANPYLTSGNPLADVDTLFGATPSYQAYKKEKPEHRLMLWHRLRGLSVKETALVTGYTPQTVSQVCKQPWFQEAFCQLSTEIGKDAVETFLEGEVLPALQRTADIARGAESEAVRLAANRELLDRYLGKSTVKVESKVSGQVESVVYDIAKLRDEEKRLNEQLRALTGAN